MPIHKMLMIYFCVYQYMSEISDISYMHYIYDLCTMQSARKFICYIPATSQTCLMADLVVCM